ncbi:DNA polymerase III subunit alpha [Entomoplasma ellychniae]|uniref:DNA-directed DNA polymerase n=1 Tax=Entomoplasma ellychniae TaxID=2114 RepID=A0A8E2QVZ9_9MOLU|nr:DNA polymerase III subunit alpha [Entomoplasma ellychniae]PPE04707.1 DNA polymerase III subunit alpha [Entomoplasma ellychniae]
MYSPQLNVKLVYDFQKSLIKIDEYIQFAKLHKFTHLFYFENTTMFGVADFVKKCKINNIKPVIGVGVELDDNNFINILPLNKKGYQNICYISSDLNLNNIKDNNFKINIINKYVDTNNIVITNVTEFRQKNSLVQEENFYDLNYIKIYPNAIRYFDVEDKKYFLALYALKNNISYQEAGDIYNIDESYPDGNIDDIYPDNDKLLKQIAFKSFHEILEDNEIHFGVYNTPNNIPSFKFLKSLCFISLENYFKKNVFSEKAKIDYIERLNTELSVIEKTGFADYFLIVQDYVLFAKKEGILVGPGRGSAAGSLVSFLLKITTIDPIEYGLLFERFLNPERITMPDIDIDFQDDRRNEVVEYLFEKYGKFNVATIVTFQTIAFKSAFRDSCRVFNVDIETVNIMSKEASAFDQDFDTIINKSILLKSYSKSNEYDFIFKLTKKLMGMPRQTGTHAAGVVITNNDLRGIVPIKEGVGGISQTQFNMNHLEETGLIKMDILGLRNLSTLNQIINLINKNYKKNINLLNINLKDAKVFNLLSKGETTGIFQLESEGMTDVVKKMKVSSIDDIAIASALFRPGPQEMIPQYIQNKKSTQLSYVDSALKSILEPTFGIIVYQEQVINILQKIGNFTLGKADIIRRAMSKKDVKYMSGFRNEFILNAQSNNISIEKATNIWIWIEKFANYGFNKSHAIAYSFISYWLAWFKFYYPAEFYSALLNHSLGDKVKSKLYIQQLKKYGVEIVKPSIKNLNINYVGVQKKLYMPLTIINGINKDFVLNLRNQSQEHQDLFSDLNNFFFYSQKAGITENNYDALAKSGAFDCFGYDSFTMVSNKQFVFGFINSIAHDKSLDQQQNKFRVVEMEETDSVAQSQYEKEIFGFYINDNPITKIKNENAFFKPQDIDTLVPNIRNINLIGQIVKIKTINDKKNEEMAFIEFLDETGILDITIFASTFKEIKNEIILNKNYIIEINVQEYGQKTTGVFNKIVKPIK